MEHHHVSVQEIIRELDHLLAMDRKEAAAEFLDSWRDRFEKEGNWGPEITILNEQMGFYRNAGNEEKGMEAVRRSLTLLREHRLADTVSGATTYLNAATNMKAFGRTEESIPYYKEAARVYQENLSPGDYRFGGLYHNMALALAELGKTDEAEFYYEKALSIMQALRPGSIMEMAVTYLDMALLREEMGKAEEADELVQKAMECFHDPEVPHDSYYAFIGRKCAGTFDYFGYFRMKKEILEEAEEIYRENDRRG